MLQIKNLLVLKLAMLAIILLVCRLAGAQILTPDNPTNKKLFLLEEQFRQEHYAITAQMARQIISENEQKIFPTTAIDIELAKYYLTLSDIKTETAGWEDSALNAMEATPVPVYRQRIAYSLAQYYFRHNKLSLAIPYYEMAGISNLSNEEIADEKFEMAYCYFNSKQFDKAEPLFSSIKEIVGGKYFIAGNYYYGLLAYNGNKFNEALSSFDNVKNEKQYRLIVPYYIAETYYFMGNKTRAYEQALSIISNKAEKSYYDNELNLLAAQCLFEDLRYKEAMPYFEYYYEHTDKIRKEDLYKMAYCYYKVSDWSNAIEKFKLLSNSHDSLGQTSMYLLGDCYLKTYNKQSARNAYSLCSDLTFNRGQQEASMMLDAMINYELGYDDEASRQLKNLLTVFPGTDYKDEASKLLSDLLIKTHNYSDALRYLDVVKRKDEDFRKTYQKATFGFAIQQYRLGNIVEADKYFTLSLRHPSNPYYETVAYFWKGELAYKLHNYDDAIINMQEFIDRKGDNQEVEKICPQATIQHAYLNMGFSANELQNYKEAQGYFLHAQQTLHGEVYSIQVATLHEADAVFMQKGYARAILLYNKIINTDSANADYAKYQKSIILGLLNKNNEKINLLQSIIEQKPVSVYCSAARYEIALTYIEDDKYEQALNYLSELTNAVTDKSYASRAWMKIGFVYQQNKEDDKAITAYKHVLIDFPASEDRIAAFDILKTLYIQNNHPDGFAKLLKENNLPAADSNSVDTAYYAAAEMQFSTGYWAKAKDAFAKYLHQYPNGIFAIKAHYYKAECNYQIKNYKEAQEDYKIVLSNAWNDFSENSARHCAAIAFEEKDYTSAYNYFMDLRLNALQKSTLEVAYYGLMKSSYFATKTNETALYADSLLSLQGIATETINDALLYKANAMRINNNLKEALMLYKQLSNNKNGEIAAESRYRISEIYLNQDSLQKAETAVNETIRQSAGYDYWIVKSYITLSDLFVKQKDYFNAKATLESIVKHTKITDLKQEAIKKLDEVKKLEKQKSKLKDE